MIVVLNAHSLSFVVIASNSLLKMTEFTELAQFLILFMILLFHIFIAKTLFLIIIRVVRQ